MKKFALVTVGFEKPTQEVMAEWMKWFQSIGTKMESQLGFRNGKEVKPDGKRDLAMDRNAMTGMIVLNAESMEEAIEIAETCPMVTSTLVYEVMMR